MAEAAQSISKEPGSEPVGNPKRERFCREWIIDHNGTQAAIRAGYSAKTAKSAGQRLLTYADVRARVKFLEARIIHGLELSAETTVRELAKLAYANMDDFVTVQPDGSAVLDLGRTTRDHRAAIQEITVDSYTEKGEGGEDDVQVVKKVKLKLYDKRQALVDLGRHQGIFEADNEQSRTVVESREPTEADWERFWAKHQAAESK